MGADGVSTYNNRLDTQRLKIPKIFRLAAKDGTIWLVGICGSGRLAQLVREFLTVPEFDASISYESEIIKNTIPALRKILGEHAGFQKDDPRKIDGGILLGVGNEMIEIDSSFCVISCSESFYSVGSGEDVAKGALFATPEMSPRDRILTALRAAEQFKTGVGVPFTIINTLGYKETIP